VSSVNSHSENVGEGCAPVSEQSLNAGVFLISGFVEVLLDIPSLELFMFLQLRRFRVHGPCRNSLRLPSTITWYSCTILARNLDINDTTILLPFLFYLAREGNVYIKVSSSGSAFRKDLLLELCGLRQRFTSPSHTWQKRYKLFCSGLFVLAVKFDLLIDCAMGPHEPGPLG
jgi:hypothetical protein